jgi:hypothetical protein
LFSHVISGCDLTPSARRQANLAASEASVIELIVSFGRVLHGYKACLIDRNNSKKPAIPLEDLAPNISHATR